MVSHNIILTYHCLNCCPYCFSSKTLQSRNTPILKKKELLYYIKLLKKSKIHEIRLLGGEPFLHSNIREFIEIVLDDSWFDGLTIFTTGFIASKFHKLLCNEKVKLVVNINHPSDYKGNKFSVLKKLLFKLADLSIHIVPGFNIYKEAFDYHPIIELVDELGSKTLRWTIAVPSSSKKTECLDLAGKKRTAVRILEFLDECVAADIEPSIDCPIEPCIFTQKQFGRFAQLCPKSVSRLGKCHPVLDLGPDYKVQRCFAAQELLIQDMRNYDSLESLNSFYNNALDRYRPYSVEDKCQKCDHMKKGNCFGGCIAANADKLKNNLTEIERVSKVLQKCKALYKEKKCEQVVKILKPVLEIANTPEAIEEYANALFQSGRKKEFVNFLEKKRHYFLLLKTYRPYLLLAYYHQLQGNIQTAFGHLRQCLRKVPPANRLVIKAIINKLEKTL
jgi:MoaA/NifB/PqqE/SkfB family radical SAM enzyme